jgi:hypothetical protein
MTKTKWFARKRGLAIAGGLLLAVGLFACGDGGNDCSKNPAGPGCVPPTTTLPPLPPPSVVSTGQGTLEVDFVGRAAPFTTTLTGTLDATVEWTFATNDLDVFLARGDCTPQQFIDNQCNIAAFSLSDTAKPEKVRLAGAAPGVYTLLVGNSGPENESLSWQVVLTPTASSASAATQRSLELPEKARSYRGRISW